MSAAAIYDQLVDMLESQLPDEMILLLAKWIATLIETSYRTGREDGLWES